MNNVQLIGRLTRDIELKYTSSDLAIARFSIAIDRYSKSEEKQADYPTIVAFGKTAELCDRYIGKGSQVGITGRIQTGSYEKEDGTKVYTTEVIADRVEFLGSKNSNDTNTHEGEKNASNPMFEALNDDDIPF